MITKKCLLCQGSNTDFWLGGKAPLQLGLTLAYIKCRYNIHCECLLNSCVSFLYRYTCMLFGMDGFCQFCFCVWLLGFLSIISDTGTFENSYLLTFKKPCRKDRFIFPIVYILSFFPRWNLINIEMLKNFLKYISISLLGNQRRHVHTK